MKGVVSRLWSLFDREKGKSSYNGLISQLTSWIWKRNGQSTGGGSREKGKYRACGWGSGVVSLLVGALRGLAIEIDGFMQRKDQSMCSNEFIGDMERIGKRRNAREKKKKERVKKGKEGGRKGRTDREEGISKRLRWWEKEKCVSKRKEKGLNEWKGRIYNKRKVGEWKELNRK